MPSLYSGIHEKGPHTVTIDRFRDDLQQLGVRADRPERLKLFPLVHVAWADGAPSRAKLHRIALLARHYDPDIEPGALPAGWLSEPPRRAEVEQACDTLRRLATAPDEPSIQIDGLLALLAHAEWLARTHRRHCDAPSTVSARERRAIADITNWLQLSIGTTWTDVLRDIRAAA